MASAFETVIRLQLQKYSPAAAKAHHIATARAGLAAFMATQTARPMVSIETDGHSASSEEQVKPFGVITYRFSRLREIASFALREAERLSPVRSGKYKRSWFVMMNGAEVGLDQIPASGEIILTNDQPYSRKINVGAKGFTAYAPPGIVEKVRQLVLKRYRLIVSAEIQFITLSGGHVLKRNSGRRRSAGKQLTYPSLVLTSKF